MFVALCLHAAIHILDPNDVVFGENLTELNFDDFQIRAADVLQAVHGEQRDMNHVANSPNRNSLPDDDLGDAGGDRPHLGSKLMLLERQNSAGRNDQAFDDVPGPARKNLKPAPRPDLKGIA